MFVGTDEFWRWRFGRGDRYFYRFYAQAIQYLASARGGKTKTSVLTTDWPVYSLGERVTVTAEVKVAAAGTGKVEAYKGETVTVHYSMEGLGEQPPVKLTRTPGIDGRYTGQIAPKGRGRYHAWIAAVDASAERGGECDFEVKLPQLEYEDPRMDEGLLKEMVTRGGDGGRFLNLDEVRELDKLITEPERRRSVPHEHFLWDNWRLFALFSLVIIVEWVLRKRARML
jgi:hypothetical protein